VAKLFCLNDIPVREAIRRLEREGYVHFTPHVEAIVLKELIPTGMLAV